MNGVEILTSSQVGVGFNFNWIVFVIIFVFITIIMCTSVYYDIGDWKAGIPIGMAMGLFFGILIGLFLSTPSYYETQYQVTISDEVSVNEFYEKYEVVKQDGKIFTVRERIEEVEE